MNSHFALKAAAVAIALSSVVGVAHADNYSYYEDPSVDAYNTSALVMLNPQPLPPERIGRVARSRADIYLNPQPLPPERMGDFSNGEEVMLNPQPLPPGPPPEEAFRFRRGAEVMLNPQPLPPGPPDNAAVLRRGAAVMLNPQPLPPVQLFRNFLFTR